MELNKTNRSIWAAQYYGQVVKVHKSYFAPVVLWDPSDMRNCYLLLKDLRSLTDAQYLEIAQIYFGQALTGYNPESAISHIREKIEAFRLGKVNILWNAYQYLQSEGFALPWRGLTVFQMVTHGWMVIAAYNQ